jgi:F0F1-type ATP synthase gamma subunit
MRRPAEIEKEEAAVATLVELTSVFEGIASMRISQVKNQVLQATEFFNQLWGIYSQIRVSSIFGFGRGNSGEQVIEKNVIIVIGHHGAIMLAQRGISYEKYFKLPTKDQNINVAPIIREVQRYRATSVFYQEYKSLTVQEVKRIDLSHAVQEKGAISDKPDEFISEQNYIFEPTTFDVVDHLERSMLNIAVSQLILNSKLAQYASRFRAMSASHQRSDESKADLHLQYNRAKRAIKDQRLKEIINGLKMSRH